MAHAQDDFYYYLTVARNIAAGHGSTFDGITSTNGYHPLYMLLLTAVCRFGTHLTFIFKFLWFLDTLCAFATFLLLRGFFDRRHINSLVANGAAVVLLVSCMRLFFTQMEVTLTVPIGLSFLAVADMLPQHFSVRRFLLMGGLAALMILSRLDSVIFVALLSTTMLLNAGYRAVLTPARITAFTIACGLPMTIYFSINERLFHRLMPISGAAKQLKHSFMPSLLAIQSLGGSNRFFLVLTVFVLLAYLAYGRRLSGIGLLDQPLILSCLMFPVVHFTVLSFISDWPVWGWYAYSLRFSLLAIALLLAQASPPMPKLRPLAFPFCLFALVALAILPYHIDPEMLAIYQTSVHLKQFEQTHPGRYAMGDRSGMFSYLSQSPLVQTEGLMMDSAFLARIRREADLRSVLQAYHVDYYIGFSSQSPGYCFAAKEPAQAGSMAPHLSAEFCDAPVISFQNFAGTTMIYALHP